MKKVTTTLLIALLLVGLVVAINLTNIEIRLSREAEQFYKDRNIIPTYKDYEQGDEFWRCLISNTEFNLPCSKRFKGDYNDKEKEAILDAWMDEKLEDIAKVFINRVHAQEQITIREGEVIIRVEK